MQSNHANNRPTRQYHPKYHSSQMAPANPQPPLASYHPPPPPQPGYAMMTQFIFHPHYPPPFPPMAQIRVPPPSSQPPSAVKREPTSPHSQFPQYPRHFPFWGQTSIYPPPPYYTPQHPKPDPGQTSPVGKRKRLSNKVKEAIVKKCKKVKTEVKEPPPEKPLKVPKKVRKLKSNQKFACKDPTPEEIQERVYSQTDETRTILKEVVSQYNLFAGTSTYQKCFSTDPEVLQLHCDTGLLPQCNTGVLLPHCNTEVLQIPDAADVSQKDWEVLRPAGEIENEIYSEQETQEESEESNVPELPRMIKTKPSLQPEEDDDETNDEDGFVVSHSISGDDEVENSESLELQTSSVSHSEIQVINEEVDLNVDTQDPSLNGSPQVQERPEGSSIDTVPNHSEEFLEDDSHVSVSELVHADSHFGHTEPQTDHTACELKERSDSLKQLKHESSEDENEVDWSPQEQLHIFENDDADDELSEPLDLTMAHKMESPETDEYLDFPEFADSGSQFAEGQILDLSGKTPLAVSIDINNNNCTADDDAGKARKRRVRRVSPKTCPFCDYVTGWSDEMKHHIWRSHPDFRPYSCSVDQCGYCSNRKQNLQAHLTGKKHGMTLDEAKKVLKTFSGFLGAAYR